METKENWIKFGGWLLSFTVIVIGAYFIWPHIHTSLLGIILIYLGIRIFNFSTFDEYKEKRMKILKSFRKW